MRGCARVGKLVRQRERVLRAVRPVRLCACERAVTLRTQQAIEIRAASLASAEVRAVPREGTDDFELDALGEPLD